MFENKQKKLKYKPEECDSECDISFNFLASGSQSIMAWSNEIFIFSLSKFLSTFI